MPRRFRPLAALLSTLLIAGLWMMLAPAQLGGSMRMLGTKGTSMEPSLHEGDLAIIKKGTYEVGDVVAYRGQLVNAILLHRIVAIEEGRFTLKGDNNDFLDPERPTIDAILGEQVFVIPNGALVLRSISDPKMLIGLLGLTIVSFLVHRRGSGANTRTRLVNMPVSLRSRVIAAGATPSAPAAAAVILVIGFVAVGIGAAAVAAPERSAEPVTYAHQGTFSYSAEAPRSVYPDGIADTGQAIFLNVSRAANFNFAYGLTTDAATDVQGSILMKATVTDAAGWSRTVTLQRKTAFTGEAASAAAILNLDWLQRLTTQVQTKTEVARSMYQVNLQPVVTLAGSVSGSEFQQVFAPTLTLEYDGRVLRYVPQQDATVDALSPTQGGTVSSGSFGEATLTLLGKTFPAQPLAGAMAILATTAQTVARGLFAAARNARELDVPGRLRARFCNRIVELERLPVRATIAVADVHGFEKLAMASQEPILEHEDHRGVSWLLRDGETTYVFKQGRAADRTIVIATEDRVGALA
jgi:signal peptidase I